MRSKAKGAADDELSAFELEVMRSLQEVAELRERAEGLMGLQDTGLREVASVVERAGRAPRESSHSSVRACWRRGWR